MVSRLPFETIRPVQTRFRYGFPLEGVNLATNGNSPAHYAKGTQSGIMRPEGRIIALLQLVGIWFQVLLTPLVGVLFIVQSPYYFTIGRWVVLSLGGWAPQLHTEFHELRATLERRQ